MLAPSRFGKQLWQLFWWCKNCYLNNPSLKILHESIGDDDLFKHELSDRTC